ncbi:MAG: galactoside O-acetyltransferase [Betaproteobacteria bacterium]|nr:galactoside O-acetyltransferase [Betaproteobacteria bacterium]
MINPFDPGYYTETDLRDAGLSKIGKNVKIAKNCTIIGLERIEIGSNVRIDGFTSIVAAGTGFIEIGSFVHIGSHCYLAAGDGIVLGDFSGLSQGVHIYSRTDDYMGGHLTNPTVPEKYKSVRRGKVVLRKHVIVGSQTVILPKVDIGEGCSVGALSLVTKSLGSWGVYFGIPVKRLKGRSKTVLDLEQQLLHELGRSGN